MAFERPKEYTFYAKRRMWQKMRGVVIKLFFEYKIKPILLDPKLRVFEWVY